MKKLCSFLLSVSMTCALIPCFSSCGEKNNTNENDLGTIKNVIVVIGDGMGENHIWNAIDYFDLENPAFINDQIGYIGTNSLSGTTYCPCNRGKSPQRKRCAAQRRRP